MKKFVIRPAVAADLAPIMALIDATVRGMEKSEWFLPDTEEYMAAHLDGPGGFCLVAETAEEPRELAAYHTVKLAGTAPDALGQYLGMSREELLMTAQMDSCCVAAKYRGNGLQGRLIDAVERRLAGMPYRHYLATIHPDNAASLQNSLRHGYTVAATTLCYGDKLRNIMRKDV